MGTAWWWVRPPFVCGGALATCAGGRQPPVFLLWCFTKAQKHAPQATQLPPFVLLWPRVVL